MNTNVLQLELHIYHRNAERSVSIALKDLPFTIGRSYLAELFSLPPRELRNISTKHLLLELKEDGRIWGWDQSTAGTLVSTSYEHGEAIRYFKKQHERFPIARHMEIKLRNEAADGSADDVKIRILNPMHDETEPIDYSPWGELLNQLRSRRVAHLFGIPKGGKSFLARKLTAPDNTNWQRQRDAQLGGRILAARLDGRNVAPHDNGLWYSLARQMLIAMRDAADQAGLHTVGNQLADLEDGFTADSFQRPSQINVAFGRAFRAIYDAERYPLLIFDSFDAVYADLELDMFLQLREFRNRWDPLSRHIYLVLITRRPLDELRDDNWHEGIAGFHSLFAQNSIVVNNVPRAAFRKLWFEVSDGQDLNNEEEELLWQLTGGHPGLLAELFEDLDQHNIINRRESWQTYLGGITWAEHPPRCCDTIWRALRPTERDAVRRLAQNKGISVLERNNLERMGIVNSEGQVFSPIFREVATRFRHQEQQRERGLRIDERRRQVFLDGALVELTDGKELDILLFLFKRANEVCTYEELIKHTTGQFGQVNFFHDKGALQRAVSRLRKRIDPEGVILVNKQGRGYVLYYDEGIME